MATIVAERDGFDQGNVGADRRGDGDSNLGHLKGMGEPSSLMVLGENEHLRLPGEPSKGGGLVQDSVSISLETGPQGIGLLKGGAISSARRPRRPWRHCEILTFLPRLSAEGCDIADLCL